MSITSNNKLDDIAATYNEKYLQANHFNYKTWVYRPFVKALIKMAKLKKDSRVLDAGCGQGFFTSLFADYGLSVKGVDISAEGICQAREHYGSDGAKFEVGDICNLPYEDMFDCVYSRSCSLYNRNNFDQDRSISDALLKYVKPGGTLVFDYYSNLCARKKSASWIYHSVSSVRQHFSPYPGAKVYFSLRIDTALLGSAAFYLTNLNMLTSRITGIGGDLIAIVQKSK
ncbi:MAG: class I SAM-dependent methyltransferase [Limisphaerales bacterium]